MNRRTATSHKTSASHKHLVRFDEHHIHNVADWLADSAHQHFDDVAKGAVAVFLIRNDDWLVAIFLLIACTSLTTLLRVAPTLIASVKSHFAKTVETPAEKTFDKELAAMVRRQSTLDRR